MSIIIRHWGKNHDFWLCTYLQMNTISYDQVDSCQCSILQNYRGI